MTTPRHARDELATVTIDLADIGEGMVDSVGGKADGLAAMIRIGERVPAGFCLTTKAYRQGEIPEQAVLEAYRSLGGGPVAVRSSATAEDLPEASFCWSTGHLSQRERRGRAAGSDHELLGFLGQRASILLSGEPRYRRDEVAWPWSSSG